MKSADATMVFTPGTGGRAGGALLDFGEPAGALLLSPLKKTRPRAGWPRPEQVVARQGKQAGSEWVADLDAFNQSPAQTPWTDRQTNHHHHRPSQQETRSRSREAREAPAPLINKYACFTAGLIITLASPASHVSVHAAPRLIDRPGPWPFEVGARVPTTARASAMHVRGFLVFFFWASVSPHTRRAPGWCNTVL